MLRCSQSSYDSFCKYLAFKHLFVGNINTIVELYISLHMHKLQFLIKYTFWQHKICSDTFMYVSQYMCQFDADLTAEI